jgi:hypothetical protein
MPAFLRRDNRPPWCDTLFVSETVPPGVVNIYHGRPEADVNTLIDPDYREPISGFPAFKSLLCEAKQAPSGLRF